MGSARGIDGGRTPWFRPAPTEMLWTCSEPDAKRASSRRPRRRSSSDAGVVQPRIPPDHVPPWRRLATRRRSPAGSTTAAPSRSWIDGRPLLVERCEPDPSVGVISRCFTLRLITGRMEPRSELTAVPRPSSELAVGSRERPIVPLCGESLKVSDGIRTRDRRDHNPANPVVQRRDSALQRGLSRLQVRSLALALAPELAPVAPFGSELSMRIMPLRDGFRPRNAGAARAVARSRQHERVAR
jgi:hypothetical protein